MTASGRPTATKEFIETLVATIDFKHDAKPETSSRGSKRGSPVSSRPASLRGRHDPLRGDLRSFADGDACGRLPGVLAGRGEAAQQKFEVALALIEKYTRRLRMTAFAWAWAPTRRISSRGSSSRSSPARERTLDPAQIHAAESFAEMEFFFDSQGPIANGGLPEPGLAGSPPGAAQDAGRVPGGHRFFDAATTIVGGLHLAASDFPSLARHLVRRVWCPTVEPGS